MNGKISGDDVIPVPDLFSWNDLEFGSNTTCFEYLSVNENDALLQNDPPVKLMLMENLHDFDSSNYLCQAYGGKLFVPKNDEDFNNVRSLMYQNSDNCKDAYLGIKKSNDLVVDLNGNIISFVKWGKRCSCSSCDNVATTILEWRQQFFGNIHIKIEVFQIDKNQFSMALFLS